ncbi:MAG: hypothetical protein LKF99_00285 [Bifidobacterium sp.]|jgi:hypothetical protein|nr:hypothetical protein [Bifidobacterium sp.]
MSKSESTSSHGSLIAVVVAAALVIVLALLSAFIWPGWALNKAPAQNPGAQKSSEAPTTPSITASPLPSDASELLKAMPDSVLNFARTNAAPSTNWSAATPIEEYTVTYGTGTAADTITLVTAQWSSADEAKTQYDSLAGSMTGQELGAGSVKVAGSATGSYTVKTDPADSGKAVALWQNDTVVFQATGSKDAVERFYQKFPL